jgi:hypothetical protein
MEFAGDGRMKARYVWTNITDFNEVIAAQVQFLPGAISATAIATAPWIHCNETSAMSA